LLVSSKTHIITHTHTKFVRQKEGRHATYRATHKNGINEYNFIFIPKRKRNGKIDSPPAKRSQLPPTPSPPSRGFRQFLVCVCVCVYQIGKWLPAESWFPPLLSFHFTRLCPNRRMCVCMRCDADREKKKRKKKKPELFFSSSSLSSQPYLHIFMIKLTKSMTDDVLS
jgi:hypothetical protein